MKLERDPLFEEQRTTFDLRFACDDCAYFDEDSDRCVHGYPVDEHLERGAPRRLLVFCKDFSLR